MQVLVATHRDVEDVVPQVGRFWDEHYYSEYGEFNEHSTRMTLHSMVDNDLSVLIVAKVNDIVVGYIAFIIADVLWGDVRSAAELLWWVEPENRGKGIGKELMNAGLEWAEIMDCDLLEAHDSAAKRFQLCVGKP